jgi:hypothetical protein
MINEKWEKFIGNNENLKIKDYSHVGAWPSAHRYEHHHLHA